MRLIVIFITAFMLYGCGKGKIKEKDKGGSYSAKKDRITKISSSEAQKIMREVSLDLDKAGLMNIAQSDTFNFKKIKVSTYDLLIEEEMYLSLKKAQDKYDNLYKRLKHPKSESFNTELEDSLWLLSSMVDKLLSYIRKSCSKKFSEDYYELLREVYLSTPNILASSSYFKINYFPEEVFTHQKLEILERTQLEENCSSSIFQALNDIILERNYLSFYTVNQYKTIEDFKTNIHKIHGLTLFRVDEKKISIKNDLTTNGPWFELAKTEFFRRLEPDDLPFQDRPFIDWDISPLERADGRFSGYDIGRFNFHPLPEEEKANLPQIFLSEELRSKVEAMESSVLCIENIVSAVFRHPNYYLLQPKRPLLTEEKVKCHEDSNFIKEVIFK